MTDWEMREAETARKVAAIRHRQELREAQPDFTGALVGGSGHRVPPGWNTDPLMALPKRRRKARKASGGATC